MVTGAVGAGITGSFIFSQTIFSGRAGVQSRLNGAGAPCLGLRQVMMESRMPGPC